MERREYDISITVNERQVTKLIIDPHYEEKHSTSVTDDIIVKLVKLLDGGTYPIQNKSGTFNYFVTDALLLDGKTYKLVWLLEDDQIYIGVVNAYRRRKHGLSK